MPLPASPPGDRVAAWGGFVRLPENAAAVRAARRVLTSATTPGRSVPSPVVFHGLPGTGKTLLTQTLIRKLIDHPAAVTVRAVAAGEIRTGPDAEPLLSPHPADWPDVLVLEDLQHLRPKAADAVCRLLDARSARRLPTVVTAARGPAGLTAFPRRLTSRLAAGLVVQLEPLTPAGRRTLAERLAAARKLTLTADALDWLAAHSPGGGVRPVAGLVERLAVLARDRRQPLAAPDVRALLAEPSGPATLDRIVSRVASTFRVKPADVRGKGRHQSVVVPRHVAMYLAREVAKLPLARIGTHFGRDHKTVLHAVRKVTADIGDDATLARTVRELAAELG